ncbi:lytic transglycosylase domain-containing protein [Iodidimonas gelatinilytica]|nr:lytic transglycosylase domain-containing protein [Iodidimonas gelatinilytica]
MATGRCLIKELENPILMGHVLFQRYMHPTAYRSRYAELRDWMAAYADHPDATRIYKLAKKRQGNAAAPKKPVPARGIYGGAPQRPSLPKAPKRSAATKKMVGDFFKIVDRQMRRRNPDRAEKRYWAMERLNILAPHEAAKALGKVTFAHFFDGNDYKALLLAKMATDLSPDYAEDARWYGGLAAWRYGDCATALDLFSGISHSPMAGSWRRSAGAYWAARSAQSCGRFKAVTAHLRLAAKERETFYGLIAMRQLALDPGYDWTVPPPDDAQLKTILKNASVRRAIALVEIGESLRADLELRLALGRSNRKDWPVLAAFAAQLKLPASQLRVARALRDADLPIALHYPLPDWAPDGGFTVDRAIVFAFMRQESQFSSRALSHVGASGLMQVMPETASYLTGDSSLKWKRSRLYDPDFNMALGQRYIEHLADLSVVEGNLFMLAAAYNAGPGNLSRWRRKTDYRNDPLLFIESLPAQQTRNFIGNVISNLWLYRMQMGQPTPSLDAVASNAWPVYETLDNATPHRFANSSPTNTTRAEIHAGN